MRRTTCIFGLWALLLAGCGAGTAGPDPAAEGRADGAAVVEDGDEQADTGAATQDGDTAGDTGGDPPAGDVAGTYTVDGTTYEVTEVLDCDLGTGAFPEDRGFVGESADGSVRMSVSYFQDESLAGLNGADLEVDLDDGTVASITWAASYAGADAAFEITPRADGADGAAEVGAVGPDAPEGTLTATWSFTC